MGNSVPVGRSDADQPLEDLELVAAQAGADRRVGRIPSGAYVSARPVPEAVARRTEAGVSNLLATVDRLRKECRAADPSASHLMPLTGAVERAGTVWVATELDPGVSLRRLLAVARLTPAQACLIVHELLAGLAELGRLGLCHNRLHAGNVQVDPEGTVRLTDWELAGLAGEAISDAGRRADLRSVADVARRLAAVSPALPDHDELAGVPSDLPDLLLRDDPPEIEDLGRELRRQAPFLEDKGARSRVAAQLGELAGALAGTAQHRRARAGPHSSAPPAPKLRATWSRVPRRRGRGRVWASIVLLCVVAVVAVLVWRVSGAPAALRRLPAAASALRPSAPAHEHRPSPSTHPDLRPVPDLGPSAAGSVTGFDVEALQAGCVNGTSCPVRVTARLQPQPEAQVVAWELVLVDRCTGRQVRQPGGAVTALADWPYAYAMSTVQLPVSHPQAVVAVASSPARVASPPLPLGATAC